MSGAFLAIALLAAVMLVNWRLTLVVLAACLIALVVLGLGAVNVDGANAVGLPAPDASISAHEVSPPTLR